MATGNPRVSLGGAQQFQVFFDQIVKELDKEVAECMNRKTPGAINWAAVKTLYKQRRRDTQALRFDPAFPYKTGRYRTAVRNQVRTYNPTKRPGKDTSWGARLSFSIATAPSKYSDGFVSEGQRAKLAPRFEAVIDKMRNEREGQTMAVFKQFFDKIWEKELDKCWSNLDKVRITRVRI